MPRRHRRSSLSSPAKVVPYQGHTAPVRFVRSNPSGKYVLTASTRGTILVVSTRTRKVEHTLTFEVPGYDNSLRDILFLNESTIVFLTTCNDLTVWKPCQKYSTTASDLPSDPLSLVSISKTEFLVACRKGEMCNYKVLKDGFRGESIFRSQKKIDRVIPGWTGFATVALEGHSYLRLDRNGNVLANCRIYCPGQVVHMGRYFNLSYTSTNQVLIWHLADPSSEWSNLRAGRWWAATSWQRVFIAKDQQHVVLMSEDEVSIVHMSDNSIAWRKACSGLRSVDVVRGGNLVVGCENGKVLEFVLPNWLGVLLQS